jgi:hypothetical protein
MCFLLIYFAFLINYMYLQKVQNDLLFTCDYAIFIFLTRSIAIFIRLLNHFMSRKSYSFFKYHTIQLINEKKYKIRFKLI